MEKFKISSFNEWDKSGGNLILEKRETKTASFAERELAILEKTVPDALVREFIPEILELCEKFGKSGQSGGSAPYTAGALSETIKKLCLQKPICPITGIDEEWSNESLRSDGPLFQNRRCYALFKDETNECYYLDAIVWKTQNGGTWSGSALLENGTKVQSRQYIKGFPFEPKTFVIDVIDKDDFYIKDPKQLNEVYSYYKKKKPSKLDESVTYDRKQVWVYEGFVFQKPLNTIQV